MDALSCCQEAQELFALYQTCASRRQIDTLLQNYLDTMQAVKAARGRIYFIPRDYMPKLALFEDFIALLEPVSYTHLDVYKRQGNHCAAGSAGPEADSKG